MEELNNYMAGQGIVLEEVIIKGLIEGNQPLTEIVDSGSCSEVYKLTDDYVVKIGRSVNHEYLIAKGLYNADVSVPKPIGVFDVKVNPSKNYKGGIKAKGFVMEFVHDDKENLEISKRCEIEQRFVQELKKCRKLGFVPSDIEWYGLSRHNVLYDKKQDKLYLIDFELWEKVK